MNRNQHQDYSDQIADNSVRFEALGSEGRIHIEGSGDITMEVSVDGVNFVTTEHSVSFDNGIAIAPFRFYIGDQVRLSATTLTKVHLNYNKIRS